jgi:hypothetical protein
LQDAEVLDPLPEVATRAVVGGAERLQEATGVFRFDLFLYMQ